MITNKTGNSDSKEESSSEMILRMKKHIEESNFSSTDLRILRGKVHMSMIANFEDKEYRKKARLMMAFINNQTNSRDAEERLADIIMQDIDD